MPVPQFDTGSRLLSEAELALVYIARTVGMGSGYEPSNTASRSILHLDVAIRRLSEVFRGG